MMGDPDVCTRLFVPRCLLHHIRCQQNNEQNDSVRNVSEGARNSATTVGLFLAQLVFICSGPFLAHLALNPICSGYILRSSAHSVRSHPAEINHSLGGKKIASSACLTDGSRGGKPVADVTTKEVIMLLWHVMPYNLNILTHVALTVYLVRTTWIT